MSLELELEVKPLQKFELQVMPSLTQLKTELHGRPFCYENSKNEEKSYQRANQNGQPLETWGQHRVQSS